jgi:hypothetical protein
MLLALCFSFVEREALPTLLVESPSSLVRPPSTVCAAIRGEGMVLLPSLLPSPLPCSLFYLFVVFSLSFGFSSTHKHYVYSFSIAALRSSAWYVLALSTALIRTARLHLPKIGWVFIFGFFKTRSVFLELSCSLMC